MTFRKLIFAILTITALAGTASVATVDQVSAPNCGTACASHFFGW
jgi:hypothetical protein